jgi:hypothetical protein
VEEPEESVELLEQRIAALLTAVRRAVRDGDGRRASALRRELSETERAWNSALAMEASEAADAVEAADSADDEPHAASGPPGPGDLFGAPGRGPLLPLREQVHEALSLLQVPASPKLIATVHEAFFATTFPTARLTSLRRDEERSFKTAPFARPYYICAALQHDFLTPSRGLLAVSTWPLEARLIGPLSPRVDFLISAINVAEAIEHIPEPVPAARALLSRFAANVRGSSTGTIRYGPASRVDPQVVIRAARAELDVHADDDRRTRAEAAKRAREQLDDVGQLFGASFRGTGSAGHAGGAA